MADTSSTVVRWRGARASSLPVSQSLHLEQGTHGCQLGAVVQFYPLTFVSSLTRAHRTALSQRDVLVSVAVQVHADDARAMGPWKMVVCVRTGSSECASGPLRGARLTSATPTCVAVAVLRALHPAAGAHARGARVRLPVLALAVPAVLERARALHCNGSGRTNFTRRTNFKSRRSDFLSVIQCGGCRCGSPPKGTAPEHTLTLSPSDAGCGVVLSVVSSNRGVHGVGVGVHGDGVGVHAGVQGDVYTGPRVLPVG